jgi:hypothetical protein
MSLNLSQDDRTEIVKRWFGVTVDRYPPETAKFLRDQSDPFANPVGAALREELEPILDALLDEQDLESVEPSLDRIIRVRALQDMSPADAVSFVLVLKEVFPEVVGSSTQAVKDEFDRRVDGLLLSAFNVFSRCREQVYDIRVKEIRNRSLNVMERLNSWREQRAAVPSSDA